MIGLPQDGAERLVAGLAELVGVAEAGQFDTAMQRLVDHDARVRSLIASASPAELPRWRGVLVAQRHTIEQLVSLRDAAGREAAAVVRARIAAAAYGGGA